MIKTGKLIPEDQFDNKGMRIGDRRYVLEVSTATKHGELSEGALNLLKRNGKEAQAAFDRLSNMSKERR